ncbi:HAD-IC family P-type ATPase [Candidatus Dependentiae bacterium]|nr:HAD-IC family P-type ATPase [Candidatus Dependentiae bacterium]
MYIKPPYQETVQALSEYFKTNLTDGLSTQQAQYGLKEYGLNQLPEKKPVSLFRIFLRQFESPLIYVLAAAASIIMILGNSIDALIVSVILFFNALIGTIQEGRTQTLLASLKNYLKTEALVVRDGKQIIIPSKEVVPGDIIIIQQGEQVPADSRLINAHLLMVDEALLTGESMGVNKTANAIADERGIANQSNMVFKGTYVLSGNASALVVAIGAKTEVGKIGTLAETIHTDMPLKKDLDRISLWVLIFIVTACIFLFIIGIWHGRSWTDLLIILSALFICVVPEGLPVVFTLTLVNGAYQMAKKNIVVKRLQAVEGLGRTSVIVLDKTGTLTKNEMMVSRVYTNHHWYEITGQGYHPQGSMISDGSIIKNIHEHPNLDLMAQTTSLLNRTQMNIDQKTGLYSLKGDPTQAALYVFSQKAGYDPAQLRNQYIFYAEIPFQADLRYQADFYLKDNKLIALIVGSPELVMNRSTITTQDDKNALADLLRGGLRTIAAAYKEFDLPTKKELSGEVLKNMISENLIFLGFFGLQDTIRPEVSDMIKQARASGLCVVMATGDHQGTALYVAKAVGIYKEGDTAIDGPEFKKLSAQELTKESKVATVYSRLSPENKLQLIEAYHQRRQVVAMTGDGVNDAPSLVAADIGIAMGRIGTEAAKEVADIILLDDSFASIMDAIAYSEHMFSTLRRVILYFFATNLAEVLLILFSLGLNIATLPLNAVQIFWLNLVTDGFLNVALAVEPQEKNHYLKVSHRRTTLIDKSLLLKTFYLSLPMAIGSLGVFLWYQSTSIPLAQTMALVTMALYQWMNAWNCRSQHLTNFQIGFFSNHWLIAATSFVLFLQLLLVYAPFMQRFFHTVPLTLNQWFLIFILTSSLVIIEEARKFIAQFLQQKGMQ